MYDIIPLKYNSDMPSWQKDLMDTYHHGGWFHKETLQIAIYGEHINIHEVADTINHEVIHHIVQEFIGEPDGWEASTALDLVQFADFMEIFDPAVYDIVYDTRR